MCARPQAAERIFAKALLDTTAYAAERMPLAVSCLNGLCVLLYSFRPQPLHFPDTLHLQMATALTLLSCHTIGL